MKGKPSDSKQPETVATKRDWIEKCEALSTVFHNCAIGTAAIVAAVATWHAAHAIPKALEGHAEARATAQGTLDR